MGIHGKAFETMGGILRGKGAQLHYARALRCVASQCVAYEPFPPAWLMGPFSDRNAQRIGRQIAARTQKSYPAMSVLTRKLHPRLIELFCRCSSTMTRAFLPQKPASGAAPVCGCVPAAICPSGKTARCGIIVARAAMPAWPIAPQKPSSSRRRRLRPGSITRSPEGWGCRRTEPDTTIRR